MIENEDLFEAIQTIIVASLSVSSVFGEKCLYFDDDIEKYIIESNDYATSGEYDTLEEAVETFMNWE